MVTALSHLATKYDLLTYSSANYHVKQLKPSSMVSVNNLLYLEKSGLKGDILMIDIIQYNNVAILDAMKQLLPIVFGLIWTQALVTVSIFFQLQTSITSHQENIPVFLFIFV